MAYENAKCFFEKLGTDPEAQELLKGCPKPDKPEELLKAYTELAGKLGISLSEEELAGYLEEEKKAIESRTEAAASQIQELQDDAMDAVAGGGAKPDCKDTYRDHENCWFNDGCDNVYHYYDTYMCKNTYRFGCPDLMGAPKCDTLLY